jgi:hypothetical protein
LVAPFSDILLQLHSKKHRVEGGEYVRIQQALTLGGEVDGGYIYRDREREVVSGKGGKVK